MPHIKKELIAKQSRLKKNLNEAEKQLSYLPEGKIYARKNGKYYSYYKVEPTGQRIYIPKRQEKYIKELAQRKYTEKIYKELQYEYKVINAMLKHYHPEKELDIYQKMNKGLQMQIKPIIEPDELYAEKWIKKARDKVQKYPQNTYCTMEQYETESGEILRSKSETIISEKLNHYKIPYIYEYPLELANGKIIYPDFYILNKRTKKVYYYEHFGMMDNHDYCTHALKKIDEYAKNGVCLGQDLLVTFESADKPLCIKTLDEIIKNNFI